MVGSDFLLQTSMSSIVLQIERYSKTGTTQEKFKLSLELNVICNTCTCNMKAVINVIAEVAI